MIFRKFIVTVSVLFSFFAAVAHEGHDSATVKSLYGGIVKKTKNTFVEVLQDEEIEIYVSNHDYKTIVGPKLDIKAVADIKGKKIPLKLDLRKSNYVVTTDLSKEKHFKLSIVLKIDGKEESVIFPLEKN